MYSILRVFACSCLRVFVGCISRSFAADIGVQRLSWIGALGRSCTGRWGITQIHSDEYDSDECATVPPLEANLPQSLRPGLSFLDFSERVDDALYEQELDTNVCDTALEELASLIDVLSRSSISVFTSALFDFILTEAKQRPE